MIFAAQNLRRHPALDNPTVLIVVDRRDLKTQLSDDFDACDSAVGTHTASFRQRPASSPECPYAKAEANSRA
jgi:type I site-specific restriction-modification system R (restriction) subunit